MTTSAPAMLEPPPPEPVLPPTLATIAGAARQPLHEALDDDDLRSRRLTIFYGYFALFGVLATIGTRLRGLPVALEPPLQAFVLDVQAAHGLALCLVFLALRLTAGGRRLAPILDVGATLVTAATAAAILSRIPAVGTVDVTAVAFFVLFFLTRAALVPSRPWLASAVAAASAIPYTLGLALMYQRAGAAVVPDPDAATWAALRCMVGAVAGVYLVSRTIYGLRRAVVEAARLGQYVVHEKIAEGGMGSVYRASHAMLERPAAIKLIAPDRAGPTATARFEREVLAASRLTHPNTIAIYDFGRTQSGVFYYAMELVDGEDLERLVAREGPQPIERTRHILRQIAAALSEAHEAGLVHRDIKPSNVMLCTRSGGPHFVKVLDFGLVKDLAAPSDVAITSERWIAGTPLYMAPESIVSPATVGPSTDVYALGCVAYFLLTGQAPFDGDDLVEVLAAHRYDTPPPPSSYAPDVPPDLDALVLRCLAKAPDARPTARELEAALSPSPGQRQPSISSV